MNKEMILELEGKLGLKFKDKSLIEALTHSSYSNENKSGYKNNERLEYLGDAVLELSMSKYLIDNYNLSEGEMTKKRAELVCEDALVSYANKLELSKYLLLGNGEEQSGGRSRPAIIADAFEAILGASFTSFGFDTTYELFEKIIVPYLSSIEIKDYKSILQELVQADKRSISYQIISETGPSHNKKFESAVYMDDIMMGKGFGKTKKEAEQNAAKEALQKVAK